MGVYTEAHQIREMSRGIAKLGATLGNALIKMRQALDAQLDAAVDATWKEINDRDRQLRQHLREVHAGSIRNRLIGVALLALGIVLAGTGWVLSTFS